MKFSLILLTIVFSIFTKQTFCADDFMCKRGIKNIISVPKDFKTIAQAITHAKNGDCIVLSPGNYSENEITVDKSIIITSECIDAGEKSLVVNGKRVLKISNKSVVGENPDVGAVEFK
jgi:hypothetical protein